MLDRQVQTSEFDALKRKVELFERAFRVRFALSQPASVARDEPYEEGIQTNRITAPQGVLGVQSAIALVPQNVVLANGLNDNIPIGNGATSVIYVTGPTAGFSLGGFIGGVDGRLLIVINRVAFQMTIVEQSATSAVGSKISTLTGGNVVLRAGRSAAMFMWLGQSNSWNLLNTN